MTHQRKDVATPSLERFAARNQSITLRSSGAVREGGPVLVDMPNARLLELAHRIADGGSLCAIEGAFRLAGWATAMNAINLATGQRPEPLPEPVEEELAALRREGNNGWHDQPGKRDAKRILRELVAIMPSVDADFVIGYLVANGAFGDDAEGLRKLMPVQHVTVSVPVEDL